jgi:hypothetical protein
VGPDDNGTPIEIDRLDVVEFGGPKRSATPKNLRTVWLVLAVVVVATIALVAVVQGRRTGQPSASPTSASPAQTSSASQPVTEQPTPDASQQPIVTDVGEALLGITGSWELFVRGPQEIVRIELARGRVTRTPVPPLSSGGPVSFVIGSSWAIIRPLDAVPGYLVRDGQPAQRLGGDLRGQGPALPGPDPDHVWVPASNDSQDRMVLVDATTGTRTGPGIPFPPGIPMFASSDGAGYLLLNGVGGVYDARLDGLHRVTTGAILAIGPTRWLTAECDDRYRCATVVVDRATSARHSLGNVIRSIDVPIGVISPDGTTAALSQPDTAGGTSVHLVSLNTGADQQLAISTGQPSFIDAVLAWSPDSQWLFVADRRGQLIAVDAPTAHVHDLGVSLPAVSQLAIRTPRPAP